MSEFSIGQDTLQTQSVFPRLRRSNSTFSEAAQTETSCQCFAEDLDAETFYDENFEDEDYEDFEDDEGFDDGELIEAYPSDEEDYELYDDVDKDLYETLLAEAAALSDMPEELKQFPEWREAYADGITYQDAVRMAMGPEYASLTDQEAEEILHEAVSGMSPEEAEGFFKSLGGFVKKLAPKILPLAGGALGTLIPVPGVGTALGAALGGLAGKAISGAGRRRRPRRARHFRAQRQGRRRPRARRSGSTQMRTELMRLLQNPQLLQSLTGSLLGGRGAVRIGDSLQEVNLGAFLETLQYYAQEAAAEAHAEMVGETTLHDTDLDDNIMDSSARAETLMDMLDQASAY